MAKSFDFTAVGTVVQYKVISIRALQINVLSILQNRFVVHLSIAILAERLSRAVETFDPLS